jgi:hypothetical protein
MIPPIQIRLALQQFPLLEDLVGLYKLESQEVVPLSSASRGEAERAEQRNHPTRLS